MGFCLFNNVAVAARYAQNKYKEIERVAIIDWDVHHGNGTQGIFLTTRRFSFFRCTNIRGIRAAVRAAKPVSGAAKILR